MKEPLPPRSFATTPSKSSDSAAEAPAWPRVMLPLTQEDEAALGLSQIQPTPVLAKDQPEAQGKPLLRSSPQPKSVTVPDASSDALRVPRPSIDDLFSKIRAFHEEISRTSQSVFDNLHSQLCDRCEKLIADFETTIHSRVRNEMSLVADAFEVEAESRLAARVDQAVQTILQAERGASKVVDEKLEAGRTSLDGIVNKAFEELKQNATSSFQTFQIEAQNGLNAAKLGHAKDLEKAAQTQGATLKEQLPKLTADALKAFDEAIRLRTEAASLQLERRLTSVIDTAMARLSTEAEVVIKRETATHLVEALRARLDQLEKSLTS